MRLIALIGTDLDDGGAQEVTITVPDDQADRFTDGQAVSAVVQAHAVRKLVAPREWSSEERLGTDANGVVLGP